MNNEPVAWFYAYPDDVEDKFLCGNTELIESMKSCGKDYIITPLYTHPSEHDLGIAEAIGFEKGHKSAEDMLRQQQAEIEALKAAVRSFFNDYLDQREESDSGRVFAPIYISNCRCMTLDPMSKLMSKMRELSGAKPPPKGDW